MAYLLCKHELKKGLLSVDFQVYSNNDDCYFSIKPKLNDFVKLDEKYGLIKLISVENGDSQDSAKIEIRDSFGIEQVHYVPKDNLQETAQVRK